MPISRLDIWLSGTEDADFGHCKAVVESQRRPRELRAGVECVVPLYFPYQGRSFNRVLHVTCVTAVWLA